MTRSAQVILSAWDIIEEYVASVGAKPALFEVQERYVPETSFVTVKVVHQAEFVNRAEVLIKKDFLQFNYGGEVWGFGLSKAQAVVRQRSAIELVAKS